MAAIKGRERCASGRAVGFSVVAALLALAAVSGCGREAEPPRRIFLVTIDTLRADHLGSYGYPRGVSPFLDRLADRSTVFELAVSPCSHTAPSHASLFTSLQPAQHRVLTNGEELDEELLTIAEALGEAGYATGAFTPTKFLRGLQAGFQTFSVSDRYQPAAEVLDRARQWIGDLEEGARLFAWVHLYDVHEWNSPRHHHASAQSWVRENAELQGDELGAWLQRYHGVPEDYSPGKWSVAEAVDLYDGQLYAVDKALESFFQHLEASRLLDDSLVIITSDHGEGLGNHRIMGHGQYIYDEQILVPLLVHASDGRYRPRRVAEMVRLVDLAPTLAELTGASMEGQPIPVVGTSLASLLEGGRAPWTVTKAFAERRPADELRLKMGWLPGDVYAVRGLRHKLIVNSEGPCEFFDLERDPFELDNRCHPERGIGTEMLQEVQGLYELYQTQGAAFRSGVASPEVIEELKALGYL